MSGYHAEYPTGADAPVADPYRVESYPPAHKDPLCYPGLRPDFSFTTTVEGEVLPISAQETSQGVAFMLDRDGEQTDLDGMLRDQGVPTMIDRVPIVGFGSNACPGQLMEKFTAKYSKAIADPNDQRIVPTLKGQVDNFAAVYSSKLGIWAYVFAELAAQEGIQTGVYVNFLSPDQLVAMKTSEAAYHLCSLGRVSLEGIEKPIAAYGFAGKNNVMLHPGEEPIGKLADLDYDAPRDRQPILLESVNATGSDWPSMSEVEILDHVARTIGGRLRALYPKMPRKADRLTSDDLSVHERAQLLVDITHKRTSFVRRQTTGKTAYTHAPEADEPDDMIFGEAVVRLLEMDRLVAQSNLLSTLPAEAVDVTPRPFRELYNK